MKKQASKRPTDAGDGFQLSVSGIHISLGARGAFVLAAGVAAILYAIARTL